ncbi:MAG: arylesterase [Gammaproteobacteria bacterium]|nr:arylesterase [Gammaproteobacteria bacterium]
MLQRTVFLLLISTAVTIILSCSDTPQLQPLDKNATILAFGDSLTYGTGTSRDKAYPAVLEKLIKRKVINAGVPGETSKKGLSRLPGLISQHQPGLVIICHGGNDILRKLDLNQTGENIQKMINIARDNNSEVVLIGVPQFGLFLHSAPLYQDLADKNRTPIATDILPEILGKLSLKSDHIHPNTKGYQKLAENISLLLKHAGALPGD